MGNGQIPSIQDTYLLALCGAFADEKLGSMLQDFGGETGRLWLTRDGTTVPEAFLEFRFERDHVLLNLACRDQRTKSLRIAFAEGLDGALIEFQKFLRAGRIADKRGARAA